MIPEEHLFPLPSSPTNLLWSKESGVVWTVQSLVNLLSGIQMRVLALTAVSSHLFSFTITCLLNLQTPPPPFPTVLVVTKHSRSLSAQEDVDSVTFVSCEFQIMTRAERQCQSPACAFCENLIWLWFSWNFLTCNALPSLLLWRACGGLSDALGTCHTGLTGALSAPSLPAAFRELRQLPHYRLSSSLWGIYFDPSCEQ